MSATLSNSGGAIHVSSGSTTTAIVQGIAKSWVNYAHSSSITVRDSLNQSSMTDFDVGFAFTNFTNQFSTLGYSQTASGRAEGQAVNGGGNNTTGRVSYVSFNGTGTQIDCDTNCIACHGDLA
jgi:hypothetical protein